MAHVEEIQFKDSAARVAEAAESVSNELTDVHGEIVREILRLMGKPESLIRFVKDRPGHDRRYSIDCSKIRREWNWSSEVDFASGLAATIDWYRAHRDWMRDAAGEIATKGP